MSPKKDLSVLSYILQDQSWLTVSNGLTALRLLLSPCIVVLFWLAQWQWAFGLFFIAALTDVLDGYAARLLGQQTHLGRFLDPVADKCLLLSLFGSLSFFDSPFFHVPLWFFIVLVIREVIMLSGAAGLLLWCTNAQVAPTVWGKLTTFFQILFSAWIFICYVVGWRPQLTFGFFLMGVALFSALSLLTYAYRALRDVGSK